MAVVLNGRGEKREVHGVDKPGTTVHSEHILSAVPEPECPKKKVSPEDCTEGSDDDELSKFDKSL